MPKRADQPFLDDIAADPGNETLRLIYADWLDDHGRDGWAEFIRLRHELAGVFDDASRRSTLVEQEQAVIARLALAGDPLPPLLRNAPRVREVPGGPPLRIVNSLGATLTLIPAGVFWMGSPTPREGATFPPHVDESQWSQRDENGPQHQVTLTRPFYLGIHAVTWKEYEALIDEEARDEAGCDDESPRHPVHNLCWSEAQDFCDALTNQPAERAVGRVYRLPTEAEWEYACRADTTSVYWTGDVLTRKQATFAAALPTRVGKYPCNPFGLFDMHGNVLECCSDTYGPYGPEPQVDPIGATDGDLAVFRGGSYDEPADHCTSYARFGDAVSHFREYLGLRIAMDVPAAKKPKARNRR